LDICSENYVVLLVNYFEIKISILKSTVPKISHGSIAPSVDRNRRPWPTPTTWTMGACPAKCRGKMGNSKFVSPCLLNSLNAPKSRLCFRLFISCLPCPCQPATAIQRAKWHHSNLWHIKISTLWGNTTHCVKLTGEDLSFCSNKIESVGLRKYPSYHYLSKKVTSQWRTFLSHILRPCPA